MAYKRNISKANKETYEILYEEENLAHNFE